VVVRDHDGHVVSNLTKEDFQLFDNGKRQEITSFSAENAGAAAASDRSLPDAKTPPGQSAGGAGIGIPTRFITYFFDDFNIRDFGDQKHIKDAVQRQFGTMQPGDRVAIFTSSCTVEVDFTDDRSKLQEAIGRLQVRPPGVCRVSRAQILEVALLKAVVLKMANLPARREIIFVSSGFNVDHDRSFEEADLIDTAIRSKVSINAVDVGESTVYVGAGAASARDTSQAPRYDNPTNPVVLVDLAHGTGGTYATGNDFNLSFRKLATPESHYVLGFVPTGKADGRFHQLKVKLEASHKLTVEARNGYYATARSE
jgi:VWFA-related protein